jgi:hypothetical protein
VSKGHLHPYRVTKVPFLHHHEEEQKEEDHWWVCTIHAVLHIQKRTLDVIPVFINIKLA